MFENVYFKIQVELVQCVHYLLYDSAHDVHVHHSSLMLAI